MKCSIQLGFASLNGTFHLSPHENICTIALINIHYLYNEGKCIHINQDDGLYSYFHFVFPSRLLSMKSSLLDEYNAITNTCDLDSTDGLNVTGRSRVLNVYNTINLK